MFALYRFTRFKFPKKVFPFCLLLGTRPGYPVSFKRQQRQTNKQMYSIQ